ncbi:hypothetical protein GCM10009579_24300 [Streptomyces javensis]|uniref:Uncharacterized protein n=1 Tax=Streptomyces javensis TaxID=114698 RepID=A0ABN1WVV1_9ACTN
MDSGSPVASGIADPLSRASPALFFRVSNTALPETYIRSAGAPADHAVQDVAER